MTKTTTGMAVGLAVLLVVALAGCPDESARRLAGGLQVRDVQPQAQEGEGEGEAICNVMIRKFNDLDGDGFLEEGEPEIGNNVFVNGEGWPVYYTDPNGTEFDAATPVWCLETDISGTWTFWEGSVEGWVPTGAMVNWEPVDYTQPIPIDITAGADQFFEIIFLNTPSGQAQCNLAIRKINDLNGNGVVDGGEPEIGVDEFINSGGWPVFYSSPNTGQTESAETPTCVNATIAGLWSVWESVVDGWVPTGAYVDGLPVDFTQPVSVEISGVPGELHEVVFLNTAETAPTCNLTIRKIEDLNQNGLVDPGEPEIGVDEFVNGGGWPVFYQAPNTGQETSATTPTCISATIAGLWRVWESFLDGWFPTGTLVNGVPVNDFAEGATVNVTGACGETFEVIFLNARTEVPETGSICATKFYDDDRDGLPEGDVPVEGFRLCLLPCDVDHVVLEPLCGYTDANGTVCWDGLAPGCYTVCEDLPSGNWVATTPTCVNVEVVAGQTAEVSFGNYCTDTMGMHSKGWWHSKHGCAAICRDPDLLAALNALAPFASGEFYTKNCKCKYDCGDIDDDDGDDDDGDCDNDDDCDDDGDKSGHGPKKPRHRDPKNEDKLQTIVMPFDNCCELSCFLVAPNNQEGIGLAQQLATFVLNLAYDDCSLDTYFEQYDMTAQEIIDAAVAAWQSGDDAKELQMLLDSLNNARFISCISAEPCPVVYCNR